MRLQQRKLHAAMLTDAVASFEIIASYPEISIFPVSWSEGNWKTLCSMLNCHGFGGQ